MRGASGLGLGSGPTRPDRLLLRSSSRCRAGRVGPRSEALQVSSPGRCGVQPSGSSDRPAAGAGRDRDVPAGGVAGGGGARPAARACTDRRRRGSWSGRCGRIAGLPARRPCRRRTCGRSRRRLSGVQPAGQQPSPVEAGGDRGGAGSRASTPRPSRGPGRRCRRRRRRTCRRRRPGSPAVMARSQLSPAVDHAVAADRGAVGVVASVQPAGQQPSPSTQAVIGRGDAARAAGGGVALAGRAGAGVAAAGRRSGRSRCRRRRRSVSAGALDDAVAAERDAVGIDVEVGRPAGSSRRPARNARDRQEHADRPRRCPR